MTVIFCNCRGARRETDLDNRKMKRSNFSEMLVLVCVHSVHNLRGQQFALFNQQEVLPVE